MFLFLFLFLLQRKGNERKKDWVDLKYFEVLGVIPYLFIFSITCRDSIGWEFWEKERNRGVNIEEVSGILSSYIESITKIVVIPINTYVKPNICSICYESSQCKTLCNHHYCLSCYVEWIHMGNNTQCPYCRHDDVYTIHYYT